MTTTPETIPLLISDVVYRGKGLGRHDGVVVFVPGTLAGETIEARIVHRHRQYAEARLVRIVNPSPYRINPACPLSAICPGCCYQPMAYEEELRCKQTQLAGFMKRQAGADPSVLLAPVPSPLALGYRNKLSLHVAVNNGQIVLGYVGEDNVSVIDIPQCPLADSAINDCLARLRADTVFMKKLERFRSLTFRHTADDGVLHYFGKEAPAKPWLSETTVLGQVKVPAGSFFQVNPGTADLLITGVIAMLKSLGMQVAIDLYCGVGLFGLAARKAGLTRVLGVDYDSPGVDAAQHNAQAHALEDFEFIAQPAAKGLRRAFRRVDPTRTAVIVDPPRLGLDKAVVDLLSEQKPPHVIYISCAPDTMARDVASLARSGYRVVSSQLFDMFPRTPYFESLTHLQRGT